MKRVLGVDYGTVRIGVAVSDELQMLAHPVETIPATPQKAALSRIVAIAKEKDAERIVVGLPRNMDGTHGPAAAAAEGFAQKLQRLAACEVVRWDERLTSVAANRAVQASGRDVRKARPIIDQVAAQLILQSYLDRCALAAARAGEGNAP